MDETNPDDTQEQPSPSDPGTDNNIRTDSSNDKNNIPKTSVASTSYSYLLRDKWNIATLIAVLIAGFIIGFYVNPLFGAALILAGLISLKYFRQPDIFKTFAEVNNFNYQKQGKVADQIGIIFYIGYNGEYQNIVYGNYKDWVFLLFLYYYTILDGNNEKTYCRTVLSLDFMMELPAFVLRKHKLLQEIENEGESLKVNNYTEKIDLEGDFNDYFQVYIRPDSQDDVLTLLTPDVMQILIRLEKYEIEMTDLGVFYIYARGAIKKEKDLNDIYVIVEALAVKVGATVKRKQELIDHSNQAGLDPS